MSNISNSFKAFFTANPSSDAKATPWPSHGRSREISLDEPDSETQKKRNLLYQEEARALAKQQKFFEAISSLENIEYETDDEDKFGMDLLKAECYIQLGRENKGNKAIEEVKRVLINNTCIDPDFLISLGEALGGEESFIRSIILFRLASSLYRVSTRFTPNSQVDGISRCISESKDILAEVTREKSEGGGLLDLLKEPDGAEKILKNARKTGGDPRLKVIVLDFGIEYMKDMLDDLKAIDGANDEKKALKVAWSTTHIGFVLGNVKEFDKSYRIRKRGVQEMEQALGEHAGFHHVYAVLLHNMGIVLHNSERYAEAKEAYEKTIIAKEMALDHGGKTKQDDIEETRKALEVTKQHMLLA